jgi:hypothetical protein
MSLNLYREKRSSAPVSCTTWLNFCIGVLLLASLVAAKPSDEDKMHDGFFDRNTCYYNVLGNLSKSGFELNTPEYFFRDSASGKLANTPDNLVLTLKGCQQFCGKRTFYWDSGARITTWVIPVLLLLSNIELSPIDKRKYMTVIHALGDPIDSFWSIIHKIYIWHRLYLIAQQKTSKSVVIDRLQKNDKTRRENMAQKDNDPGLGYVQVPNQELQEHDTVPEMSRTERCRVIATVLGGFEEISGARIESEDFYHMVLHQLGNIGERQEKDGEGLEDPQIFMHWCNAARDLADARTNEFLRTCFAIVVYIFGLLAAFVPVIGGGNTTPPGGRIGSALYLSWLIPLAMLSNTVGTFTSRRTCLSIMRQFVDCATKISNVQPAEQDEPAADTPGCANNACEREEKDEINSGVPSQLLSQNDTAEPTKFPGKLVIDETAGEACKPLINKQSNRVGLIDETTWDTYFDSLSYLGAIYTYRPWKVAYLDRNYRTHALHKNWAMILAGFSPIIPSTVGAFLITWYAIPVGLSCRHIWQFVIFVLWILSALFTSSVYMICTKRYKGNRRRMDWEKVVWRTVLVKDGIICVGTLLIILLSTAGIFNDCWCWSAYMYRRKDAYVPLDTDQKYIQNGAHIYSIVVGVVIGLQVIFYGGILAWSWHAVKLVRWSEDRRRWGWKQEMGTKDVEYSNDLEMLFWYKEDGMKRVDKERKESMIRARKLRSLEKAARKRL